jgi:hypothetical protein
LKEVWGLSPGEARRALTELQADMLLDQQYAIAQRTAAGGPVGPGQPPPAPAPAGVNG